MTYISAMPASRPYSFLHRLGCAWRGLRMAATERHMRFHLTALVGVAVAGWWLDLAPWEWASVLLVSALVIGLEVVNSAVERLADHLHPGEHPEVGLVKDMLAGAVLVAALCALLVAALVFLPKLVA